MCWEILEICLPSYILLLEAMCSGVWEILTGRPSQISIPSFTLGFPMFSFLCVWPPIFYILLFLLMLAIGLMIRPKTENLDVIVNVSDTESWDQHVQKLNKFLERECVAGYVPVHDLGQGIGDPGSRTLGL